MYTTEWKSNDPNAEKSKFKFPQKVNLKMEKQVN